MNFSTLCTILLALGSETPQFTLLTIAPFAAYYGKYFRMSWTYLDLPYRFVRRIRGDNYPNNRPMDVAMASS